uniref:Lysozyme n=1 Tax=Syphacia muris TaxID=451379 RepID=A0A0N5AHN1_9BILA
METGKMAWCYEHLRDCKKWANEGLALSTASNEAAKLCDCIQRQYITWIDTDLNGGSRIENASKQLHDTYPDCSGYER